MTYYGKPVEVIPTATSGSVEATLADLQTQINSKAAKSGETLTSPLLTATPSLGDNSKLVADTEFVDRANKVAAPGFILMAANVI